VLTPPSTVFRSAEVSPSPSAPPLFVDWRISSSSHHVLRSDSVVSSRSSSSVSGADRKRRAGTDGAAQLQQAMGEVRLSSSSPAVPPPLQQPSNQSLPISRSSDRISRPDSHAPRQRALPVRSRSLLSIPVGRPPVYGGVAGVAGGAGGVAGGAGGFGGAATALSSSAGGGGGGLGGGLVAGSLTASIIGPNGVLAQLKKPRSRQSSMAFDGEMDDSDRASADFEDFGSEGSFSSSSLSSLNFSSMTLDGAARRSSGDARVASRHASRRGSEIYPPSDFELGGSSSGGGVSSGSTISSAPSLAMPMLYSSLAPDELLAQARMARETLPSFEIPVQPKEKQRKSYKNENRYLTPNPMSVKFTGDGPSPAATVEVMLADENCTPLDASRQAELVGERQRPLGSDGVAPFSLKMYDTSRNEWVRLLFVVRFADSQANQWICTSRFRVDTNVKRS
jgi:hypothetical protein